MTTKLPITIDAERAKGQAFTDDDEAAGRAAQIRLNAADLAEGALKDALWLRDKLNRSIERLQAAKTVRDAYMGLTDLRTSLWYDLQTKLAQLAVYDTIIDEPTN